jgi:predicted dienelactone hydrolase
MQQRSSITKPRTACVSALLLAAGLSVCVLIAAAQVVAQDQALAQNQDLGDRLRDRLKERMAQKNTEDATDAQDSNHAGKAKNSTDYTIYKIAGLDVAVWKPQVAGKAPLVIFSHGFGGSNTQSKFIMQAMAQAGYLVVAPNHHDAHCLREGHFQPEVSWTKPAQWSETTYRDRHQDIVKLLQGLHSDPSWDKQIDWSKLALCGHSLGGYTVLGVAGAWPSWKIEGAEIKGVLALSPYCMPFVDHGALDHLNLPVMYQGGTKDTGLTPYVKRPGGAFSKTSSPAYFVEFDQVTHFSWTSFNRNKEQQDLINHYCVAFLDKYVKGSPDTNLQTKLPGVTDLEEK